MFPPSCMVDLFRFAMTEYLGDASLRMVGGCPIWRGDSRTPDAPQGEHRRTAAWGFLGALLCCSSFLGPRRAAQRHPCGSAFFSRGEGFRT